MIICTVREWFENIQGSALRKLALSRMENETAVVSSLGDALTVGINPGNRVNFWRARIIAANEGLIKSNPRNMKKYTIKEWLTSIKDDQLKTSALGEVNTNRLDTEVSTLAAAIAIGLEQDAFWKHRYKLAKEGKIKNSIDHGDKKPIIYWLSQILNDEVRESAIANCSEDNAEIKADSMSGALMAAFDWEHTKEGFDYWDERHQELIELESLKTVFTHTSIPEKQKKGRIIRDDATTAEVNKSSIKKFRTTKTNKRKLLLL